MEAATDAVCLAISDDEDYVSFDEEEINDGIQELYSDDSASDAGSDMSHPDMNFDDLNDAEPNLVDSMLNSGINNNNNENDNDEVANNTFDLFSIADEHVDNNNNINNSNDNGRQSRTNNRHNNSSIAADSSKAEQQSSGGIFSRLFGSSNINDIQEKSSMASSSVHSARRKPSKNKRRSAFDSDSDSEEDAPRRYRGAAQQQQQAASTNKATKLEKRLRRLSALKHKKEAKKEKRGRKVVHRQKVNTNVMSINLGTLKEDALQVVPGDPIFCKNEKCRTILSKHDKLLDKLEKVGPKGQKLKNKEEMKVDTENGEYIWVCQFCNTVNVVELDDEGEKPSSETLDYVIEPPVESKRSEDDGLIIFCVDVSGSMCVTQEVKGKFNLKGDHISNQLNEFSQFIDAGDKLNQYLPNQKRDVTWVSRLQAVQAAVDEQIEAIKAQKPKFKIALVSFADDVVIIGDGVQNTKVIAGDKLNDLQQLQQIGRDYAIENPIGKSFDQLSEALWKLKESGQTALGPALAVSIAMAECKRGSQVILCTDGLANVGVGSLDVDEEVNNDAPNDDEMQNESSNVKANSQNAKGDATEDTEKTEMEKLEEWYENLGFYASNKGVIVNVISITDDGCRLENLGKLTDACNGTIKRINPLKLTEKFSGILGNDVLATRTQATLFLHPGLQFFSSIASAVPVGAAVDADGSHVNEIDDLLNLVDLGVKQPELPRKAEAQAKAVPPTSGTTVSSIMETVNEDQDTDAVAASATSAPKSKPADKAHDEEDKKDNDSKKDDSKKAESKTAEESNDSNGRGIELVHHESQDVGNVFADSELFFEYIVRKNRIPDFRHLSHLPFQCHIEYEKLDGTKMLRVITQMRPVVFDRKKARERVNVDILAKYGTKVTTELCSKGDYESSRAFTQANTVWMQRNITQNQASSNLDSRGYRAQMISLANYANENMVLDHHMKKQQITESAEVDMMAPQYMYAQQPMHANAIMGQAAMMPMQQQQQQQSLSSVRYGSMAPHSSNNSNNNDRSHSHKSNSKSKAKSRKAARNDKFSTAMYRMKKK